MPRTIASFIDENQTFTITNLAEQTRFTKEEIASLRRRREHRNELSPDLPNGRYSIPKLRTAIGYLNQLAEQPDNDFPDEIVFNGEQILRLFGVRQRRKMYMLARDMPSLKNKTELKRNLRIPMSEFEMYYERVRNSTIQRARYRDVNEDLLMDEVAYRWPQSKSIMQHGNARPQK